MVSPISDFEELLNIIEGYENINIDDDNPAPKWVTDMIDDLRRDIVESINFCRNADN